MSSPPVSMRLTLRERTRDSHARVDRLAEEVASVGDPTGCRIFLEAMRSAMRRHGDVLDHCSQRVDLPPRADTLIAALDDDLRSLDASWSPPVCQRLPVPDNDIEAWGAAYVFEGSAFGAALLVAQAAAADLPHRYLTMLSDERASRWPLVQAAINDIAPERIEVAVASADATFAEVESALRTAASQAGR